MTKIIQVEMCDHSCCPHYTLLACQRERNYNVAYCVYSHPFRVIEPGEDLFPEWCPLEGEEKPPLNEDEVHEIVRKVMKGIL